MVLVPSVFEVQHTPGTQLDDSLDVKAHQEQLVEDLECDQHVVSDALILSSKYNRVAYYDEDNSTLEVSVLCDSVAKGSQVIVWLRDDHFKVSSLHKGLHVYPLLLLYCQLVELA